MLSTLQHRSFAEIDDAEWDKVMAVNVRGVFDCAKAVLPAMQRQGYGKIINMASGTVFKGSPLLLHYVTSKGAIVAMTRALARELGPSNILVNAIAPGLTKSDGVNANHSYTQAMFDANRASRALKREQQPQDLVGAVLFLASPESDFMTGQTMVVDGGSVTH
jgi:NAD(P)-dependent dehydrogenase (short-subunit alcohol dehydrogenase family)